MTRDGDSYVGQFTMAGMVMAPPATKAINHAGQGSRQSPS